MCIVYDPVIYGSDFSSIALIIQLLCDVTFANTLYFLLCFWFLSHSFPASELATPMENQRFSKYANEINQYYTLNIASNNVIWDISSLFVLFSEAIIRRYSIKKLFWENYELHCETQEMGTFFSKFPSLNLQFFGRRFSIARVFLWILGNI